MIRFLLGLRPRHAARCRSQLIAPRAARFLVTAALAAGCAGGSPPGTLGPPRRAPGDDGSGASSAPARWDYHPPAPETLLAAFRMSDGTCVITSPRGQRWRVGPPPVAPADASPSRSCTGPVRASSTVLPEDLVEIIRRGPSTWLFVGASGTLYEASDPLGPIGRTLPSPEPLVKVAGAGTRILGATADGRLLRWQEPAGWSSIDVPEGRVLDVAATSSGGHVVLTMPEAVLATEDAGGSWQKIWPDGAQARAFGAFRLGSTADGDLAAEGVFESLAIRPRAAPPTARVGARVLDGPGIPPLSGTRAPSAHAVLAGRAALDGERYLEVLDSDDDDQAFVLARGRLEGTLATSPVPGTERCDEGVVGAAGRHVAVACVPKGAGVVRLLRSSDAGGSWTRLDATLAAESGASVRVAVSAGGAILVTGACRPADADACKPRAPILVPAGVAPPRSAIGADLNEVLAAPAFSPDGRRAYVLGRRAKDDRIAMFVSHDGGESFASRPLDPPGTVRPDDEPPPEEESDDPEELPQRRAQHDEFDPADGTLLRPGDDGTLGVVLRRPRGEVWVTTDEDGRLLGVAYPPDDDATVTGFGRRVIAVGSRSLGPSSDRRESKVWESLDGGSSWTEAATTPALEEELATGELAAACGAGGCLLGDSVSRIGWGGSVAQARPPAADDALPSAGPAVRTVISCEATPGSRWTRIENVVGGAPGAGRAMRGRAAWSVATFDPKTTAVATVNAMLPEGDGGEPRVVTRTLLGKRARVDRVAVDLAPQVEGYAAARVEVPLDDKGRVVAGAPMRALEVAWDNLMDGSHGKATIADAGPFEAEDVSVTPGGPHRYDPALVSVSLRGVFVRPHAGGRGGAARTWFLDDRGRTEAFEPPVPSDKGPRGPVRHQHDVVIVDGRPVILAKLVDPGRWSYWLAGRAGDGWTSSAHVVAPPRTERRRIETQVELAYSGGRVGLATQAATSGHERAFGAFWPLLADATLGAIVATPTQLDLGEQPAPCSAQARAATARVEAPMLVGTRHPVLVADPDAPGTTLLLMTGAAVLHGTPAAPCVAAWEAAPRTGNVRVLIGGDPSRAFLFRTVQKEAEQPAARTTIEVRSLSCRYDPAVRAPEAVFDEPLTIRMRR